MQKSFIVLSISGSVLAISSILEVMSGLLNLQHFHRLDGYIGILCRIAFYLSFLSFCSHVYAVMSKHRWTSSETKNQHLPRPPEEIIGIGVSCIFAFFFTYAIARQQRHIANAVIIYCLFLFTSALLIQPSGKGWKGNLVNAIWPALFFLLSAVLQLPWEPVFLGLVGNEHLADNIDAKFTLLLLGASICVALIAVPGIMLANLIKKSITIFAMSLTRGAWQESDPIRRHIHWPLVIMAIATTATLT
ncbi:hypothetical protein [Janthinobacterium sp. J1-1]|uniref:hypothetical protein n=1 Tax=unclassified Janthinobacterium TaxID=2610881 RepID=UPI0028112543|nr:hypothetical protein [Janthinobacterium sp. J1-1]